MWYSWTEVRHLCCAYNKTPPHERINNKYLVHLKGLSLISRNFTVMRHIQTLLFFHELGLEIQIFMIQLCIENPASALSLKKYMRVHRHLLNLVCRLKSGDWRHVEHQFEMI